VKKGLVEVVGKLDEDQVLEAALEADVDDVDTKVRVIMKSVPSNVPSPLVSYSTDGGSAWPHMPRGR
jgi:5,10-methenyltetrahydromethanopterin hydrogenase